jgi:hypothetical protein
MQDQLNAKNHRLKKDHTSSEEEWTNQKQLWENRSSRTDRRQQEIRGQDQYYNESQEKQQ